MKVAVLALLAALVTAHTFVEDSQDYDHVSGDKHDDPDDESQDDEDYIKGRYYGHGDRVNTGFFKRELLVPYEHTEGQGFTPQGAEKTDFFGRFRNGTVLVGRRLRGAMLLVEKPEDDSARSDDLFVDDGATQDEGPSSAFARATLTRTTFLTNQERTAVLLASDDEPKARDERKAKVFLGQGKYKRASHDDSDDDDDDKPANQAVGGLDLRTGRRTNYFGGAKELLGLGDGDASNGLSYKSGRETIYLKPESNNLLAAKAKQSSSAFNSATKTDTNFLAKAIEDIYLTSDDDAGEIQDIQDGDGNADDDSQVDALPEDVAESQDYYQDELNGVYHPWNDWTPNKTKV